MKLSKCLLILAVFALAAAASADSLWTQDAKPLTADPKAHQVGDIVTVLVDEASATTQKATTGFDKKVKHDNEAGVGPIVKLLPKVGVSSAQSGSASGSTTKTMTFTAEVTATVTKVNPNGDLVLEGARVVETNGEKQELKVSGTVRPQDIGADNTVSSIYLANAQIKCTGKGPIGDRQKEGLLSKIVKVLF